MEFNDRRRVDSRELTKGERVRLHTGQEGQWSPAPWGGHTSGAMWEGTVTSVNQHAVHFAPTRLRSVDKDASGQVRVSDNEAVFGRTRLRHDAITHVQRL